MDTKQLTVRDGKYISLKEVIENGRELFPGLASVWMKEGVGYALFTEFGYKSVKKTVKRLVLHMTYMLTRTSVEAMVKKNEVLKTYNHMKARKAFLKNEEKVNMEELLGTFHSNDQQTNGNMGIDSDEETATHGNKMTPHRSTNRAAMNHYSICERPGQESQYERRRGSDFFRIIQMSKRSSAWDILAGC